MKVPILIALLKVSSYILDFLKNIFLLAYLAPKYPPAAAFGVFLSLPLVQHILLMITGADPLGFLRIIMNVLQAYIYILLCDFSKDAVNVYVTLCVFNLLLLMIDLCYRGYTNKIFEYLVSSCVIYSRSVS
jgi:hypothetical protein